VVLYGNVERCVVRTEWNLACVLYISASWMSRCGSASMLKTNKFYGRFRNSSSLPIFL